MKFEKKQKKFGKNLVVSKNHSTFATAIQK
jgi:hypothetical protein